MSATTETIQAAIEGLGLTMTAEFVPWSRSRNKGEKSPSLNWKVTLSHKGRAFLTTDYSAGLGHCPSYKEWSKLRDFRRLTVEADSVIRKECETGVVHKYMATIDRWYPRNTKPILPGLVDVLSSLTSDAEALDYGDYESWASTYGYDTDSRNSARIYRACLEIGLKLRSALGEEGLRVLRDAVRDY